MLLFGSLSQNFVLLCILLFLHRQGGVRHGRSCALWLGENISIFRPIATVGHSRFWTERKPTSIWHPRRCAHVNFCSFHLHSTSSGRRVVWVFFWSGNIRGMSYENGAGKIIFANSIRLLVYGWNIVCCCCVHRLLPCCAKTLRHVHTSWARPHCCFPYCRFCIAEFIPIIRDSRVLPPPKQWM